MGSPDPDPCRGTLGSRSEQSRRLGLLPRTVAQVALRQFCPSKQVSLDLKENAGPNLLVPSLWVTSFPFTFQRVFFLREGLIVRRLESGNVGQRGPVL